MPDKARLHYGWVIIGICSLTLFVALGLGRFAYAVFLPGMHQGAGLSYRELGFIGTCNFGGYLAAVLVTPLAIRRFRHRGTIAVGLFLICLSMFGISRSDSFTAIATFYTLVGIGTGLSNVATMVLLPHWFRAQQRGRASGLAICGNGLGIIFSGYIIPLLNRNFGASGWRHGWLIFSCIALVAAAGALSFLRNTPLEMGLEPLGAVAPPAPEKPKPTQGRGGGILLRLGILYALFGVTFMVYGTFIVATMVKEYGFSEAKAGLYWSWVGCFSTFSGVTFGTISDRLGRNRGLALVFLVQTTAYLLAGFKLGGVALMLSVLLFGSAFFAIPAIMAAAVGDYIGPSGAAKGFVLVTICFAVGQTLGPGGAGMIAAVTGNFTSTFLISASLTAVAALLAVTLPRPQHS